MNPTNSSTVDIEIASLAHGGAGVGRLNDFVYFVRDAAPGDLVRAKVTHLQKNYAEAELVEVLRPSQSRRQPPCVVAGICGGCQWQHVEYSEQLSQKQKIVEHALSRIAKEDDFELKQIIPSPQEFNYRNRAQVRTKGAELGFYKRESHRIVSFEECKILDGKLNEEILKIKTEIKNQHPDKTSKIEIFLTQKNEVARSNNKAHGQEFGFSQVNTLQNQQMQKYILDLAGASFGQKALLDLYCGNGNFSFPLAERGWDVYGIDSNRSAIGQARQLTKPPLQTYFSCDDGANGLRKLVMKNKKFEIVLLDPPRIGADEKLIKNLAKTEAPKLIYVSCNPATFARDWARLKASSDYRLISVQPFDMFPQTFHVELVALAEKRS